HFATIAIKEMAGVVGIEPTSKVLETFVLPLNYTPILIWWRGRDSNSRTRKGADLQSAAFSHFATPPSNKCVGVVARGGIEPPTQGLSDPCSTDCATDPFLSQHH